MKKNDSMSKLFSERTKYSKYCWNCGHTMTFFSFEKDRKLCSHCKRYNYKDDTINQKLKQEKKLEKFKKLYEIAKGNK